MLSETEESSVVMRMSLFRYSYLLQPNQQGYQVPEHAKWSGYSCSKCYF